MSREPDRKRGEADRRPPYDSGVPTQGDASRLRRLQLVTDAALAHLELDELLGELLARIRDALDAETVAILLLDRDANELVARAAVGLEEEVEQGTRIPIGQGFAGRVAADRLPIILEDVDHADVLNPILRQKKIKSLLGVPLIVNSEILGMLHVNTLSRQAFNPNDVELLQLVADRVSLAIEHARLFEAERSARRRLELVQSVTETALAHLQFDELLSELLKRVHEVLGTDTATILLEDEGGRELVARAAIGLEEEVEQQVRIPIGRGFAGRVAAERRPIVLDDVDLADVVNPLLREKGIKSMLGVPLVADEKVVGVLHVGTLEPRIFTADDTEVLQLVADRAALAIEKARVHDELVRLDQLKLNFVAVASHELRTPATAVFGITATLREHGDSLPDETRRELEETLWEQASRLRRLIEQLLDLSRLDSHAVKIERQALELRPLLTEIAATCLEVRSADVQLDLDEGLEVFADRLALERIFSNLLSNAFHYGKPPVVVTASALDRYVRISVEDEGQGVPSELVPRLFSRFERGSVGQGSGLGLSIARTYAQAHGGDLTYDQHERGGARFQLILPADQSE